MDKSDYLRVTKLERKEKERVVVKNDGRRTDSKRERMEREI